MADNIRIGIVSPNDFIKRLPFGGASGLIQNLVDSMDAEITIFGSGANGTPLWKAHRVNGNTSFIPTYPIEFPPRRPLRLTALFGYLRNRRRILNENVDLLYVHSPECALPFLVGRNRKPVVFHQHGSGNPVATATFTWARNRFFSWLFDKVHHFIYRRSDWIVAIDRLCLGQVKEQGAEQKTSLLMNAVDSSRFTPDDQARTASRSEFGLVDGEIAVLFVGRLEEIKQVDRLIAALSELQDHIQVRLLLAGDGRLRPALEEQAAGLGLADRVVFLGKVAHDQLPAFYNLADLLALPSKMEGVPMVILEALACGTPVLATPVGGIPDLITDDENGLLLTSDTSSCIAAGIEKIAISAWDRRRVAGTVEQWSATNVAARLNDVFRNLVTGGQS